MSGSPTRRLRFAAAASSSLSLSFSIAMLLSPPFSLYLLLLSSLSRAFSPLTQGRNPGLGSAM